jgi:hypothetical protein
MLAGLAIALVTTALVVPVQQRHQGAHAEGLIFGVNSTADEPDYYPGDSTCAGVSKNCNLRAAIMEANALSGADSVMVPAGTYTLSIAGAGEEVAATGDLDITGDLTITGAGIGVTIVDAAQLDRAFDVVSTGIDVTISDMTIRNGRSDPNDGGAIHSEGTLTLERVWIENSHADDGGALVNLGAMTVQNSTITYNVALDTGGGIQNQGTLTVRNSTIDANTALSSGGGINNLEGVTIRESLIAHNSVTSGNGGGMASYANATLSNVTVSGNSARINGGGISSESGLAFTNVTITDNSADMSGAGLFTNSSATQSRNTIIAANHDDQCAGTGGYISQGNNISSDESCLYAAGGDRENTDPLLGPLAGNGGPTLTHAPLKGSPTIDGTTTNVGCPSTDQRGVARPQNGHCDIGAFEVGELPTPTSTPTNTPAFTNTPTPTTPPPSFTPARTVTATPTPTPGGTTGDANCNYQVNSVDAAVILQYVAGLLDSIRCPDAADTNGDGQTNSIDSALILQYSAGLLDEFPV